MSTRCSAITTSGPCRAWAVRGTDPPLCSAHSGRSKGAGAPPGNTNALTAGFYSPALRPDELADLVVLANSPDLKDEIGAVRVILRRVLEAVTQLNADLDHLSTLAANVCSAARTVSRLLRDQRAISGEAASGAIGGLTQILEELGEELGGRFFD